MARLELPPSQLRTRRRKRRIRLALFFAAVFVLLCAGLVAATHIQAIRVSHIEVQGVSSVASSTLLAAVQNDLNGSWAWLVPHDNIFVYPKHLIEQNLAAHYPQFANVEVHAVNFDTIAVVVVERQPTALWCAQEGQPASGCYFMDENGVVYAPAPSFSEPVYVQYFGTTSGNTLPQQYLNAQDFAALSALVNAITQKLATSTPPLQGVVVDNNQDVSMQFADASGQSFELLFALNEQGGDVFERLSLALTSSVLQQHQLSELEYLDLRFGNKLYYKLKAK